jgi:hypothetical protein
MAKWMRFRVHRRFGGLRVWFVHNSCSIGFEVLCCFGWWRGCLHFMGRFYVVSFFFRVVSFLFGVVSFFLSCWRYLRAGRKGREGQKRLLGDWWGLPRLGGPQLPLPSTILCCLITEGAVNGHKSVRGWMRRLREKCLSSGPVSSFRTTWGTEKIMAHLSSSQTTECPKLRNL